jgi:HEAT repeat protein
MTSDSRLLTDEQMRQFVTEGYVVLKADFADEFHQKLSETLNQVYKEEGNPGNNLLPRIPDLAKVFDHPVIRGALSSVLGADYMMHPHRHGHFNRKAEAGGWHKDSYWGHYKMRNHHPWWAMIFYYPQEVTLDMGPTGIMPGTQCYQTRTFAEDETREEVKATGKAGTFALVHYDIWHRANANIAGKDRYMLKFQFMRRQAPQAASWDNRNEAWSNPESYTIPINEHEVIWRDTWNWLLGKGADTVQTEASDDQIAGWLRDIKSEDTAARVRAADQLGLSGEGSNNVTTALVEALHDASEPVALNAAYGLARQGEAGIKSLIEALQDESIHVSRTAAYGASAAGKAAVQGLVDTLHSSNSKVVGYAAFALGEIGEAASGAEAVSKLVDLMNSEDETIRRNVVEALGLIGSSSELSVKGLELGMQDADDQVRFMAGMAFAKLGSKAQAAVSVIAEALNDENRYVRATAVDALYSINTDKAKDILLRFLRDSRWCSSTTPNSTF